MRLGPALSLPRPRCANEASIGVDSTPSCTDFRPKVCGRSACVLYVLCILCNLFCFARFIFFYTRYILAYSDDEDDAETEANAAATSSNSSLEGSDDDDGVGGAQVTEVRPSTSTACRARPASHRRSNVAPRKVAVTSELPSATAPAASQTTTTRSGRMHKQPKRYKDL